MVEKDNLGKLSVKRGTGKKGVLMAYNLAIS